MHSIIIHCLGEDDTASKVMNNLRMEGFIVMQDIDPALIEQSHNVIILLTLEGIHHITPLSNFEHLIEKVDSVDELNAATQWQLMKEVGLLKHYKIIAVPKNGDLLHLRNELAEHLLSTKKSWQSSTRR